MRKIRKLSFLGILGVVIAVLFLISISFTQAQVKIQDKPPWAGPKDGEEEATWAVELPVAGTDGTMLYGDDIRYTNNDADIRIKVEKGSSMVRVDGKRKIVFYYYFSFKLVNPTYGRYVGFQGVEFNDVIQYPDEGPCCIFPFPEGEGCGNDPKTCMECFLNQDQPHSEYEYFYLKFQVGQHSFTDVFGDSIEGIEDMPLNIPVKFISYSDWIKIRVQNQEDFSDPDTEYHNIECDERNYDDGDLDNMNIWIVKLEENKWRIYVGDPYEGIGLGEDLWVQEQYTKRAEGKGKKGGTKTVTVVPLEAEGNFSFYIDFIKNPTTN